MAIKNNAMLAFLVGAAASLSTASALADPISIDIGEGRTVQVEEKLRIAFITPGSNNLYVQAGILAAKETAEEAGAELTILDANWDAGAYFRQLQNVLASNRYNAVVVEPVDPNQICDIVSKKAADAGVVAVTVNAPICGRARKTGDEMWTPGTLAHVGGSQTEDAFKRWLDKMVTDNPGPEKVAILVGPPLAANTLNAIAAIDQVKSEHPEFDIVVVKEAQYLIEEGYNLAQSILQANPDLTVFAAAYSDVTRGAIQAIKGAGKEGTIEVYDFGGNSWSIEEIKAGRIAMTSVMLPYSEMATAIQSLADAWAGKPVKRVYDMADAETVPGTPLISQGNIDKFTPEF